MRMRTNLTRIALSLVVIIPALGWSAPAPVAAQSCDAGYTFFRMGEITTYTEIGPLPTDSHFRWLYGEFVTYEWYVDPLDYASYQYGSMSAAFPRGSEALPDFFSAGSTVVFLGASVPTGYMWCVAVPATPTATPLAATATPEPTATPLPSPLPTLLPDQTLTALTTHSQAVGQLGTKPAGIAMIALLFLWGGLWLLTKR